jgi:hypothetical protein
MGDLSDQFSRLGLSDLQSRSASQSPASCCPLSASQQRHINHTVNNKIRCQLVQSDLIQGTVYAAKETCSQYTKFGWTPFDREKRCKEISSACKVDFRMIYQTPPFLCAFRAEQIVQALIQGSVHQRAGCKCRTEHHDWHMTDFHRLIAQSTIVYTWLAREPYDMSTGKLKPEWVQALDIWCEILKSTVPLEWDDFFLSGLSLRSPSCQVPLSPEPRKSPSPGKTARSASASPEPCPRMKKNGSRVRPQRLSQFDSSPASIQPNSVFDDDGLSNCGTSTPGSSPILPSDTTPSKLTKGMETEASPASTLARSDSPIHFSLPKLKKPTEPVVAGDASEGNNELDEEGHVIEDPAQMSETESPAEYHSTPDDRFLLEGSRSQTIIAQCHASTAPSQPLQHPHGLDSTPTVSAAPPCLDGVHFSRAKPLPCVYAACFLCVALFPVCAAYVACGLAALPLFHSVDCVPAHIS